MSNTKLDFLVAWDDVSDFFELKNGLLQNLA